MKTFINFLFSQKVIPVIHLDELVPLLLLKNLAIKRRSSSMEIGNLLPRLAVILTNLIEQNRIYRSIFIFNLGRRLQIRFKKLQPQSHRLLQVLFLHRCLLDTILLVLTTPIILIFIWAPIPVPMNTNPITYD